MTEWSGHDANASLRDAPFLPIRLLDGYLPIEDHGIIGDGMTAALVGRDGTIDWLCVPRFDKAPIFCSILDRERGGAFRIEAGDILGARHRYLNDTPILITEVMVPGGVLRITDLMPLRNDADLNAERLATTGELFRTVEVLTGEVEITAKVSIRDGIEVRGEGGSVSIFSARHPEVDLKLECSRDLQGAGGTWTLERGESVRFCLRWNGGTGASSVDAPVAAVTNTITGWDDWLRSFRYDGPHVRAVRRSAVTIKLLDYVESGSMVAAPTSSLPEDIGGERNWDYRYVWIRDTALAVYALRRLGFHGEAWGFLQWVLKLASGGDLNIMYTLDGNPEIPEWIDEGLSGYRHSAPVRWGNGAANQRQHDLYGEIVDCAYQWTTAGGILKDSLWNEIRILIEQAADRWNTPDQGIWEVRNAERVQTYSAGMCAVALDRGARMARDHGLPGDVDRWDAEVVTIVKTILDESWNEQGQYLGQSMGRDSHLDAAVLALPVRRVLDASHPKMVATVKAIGEQLGAGDELIYRYNPEKSPDGLHGSDGAFLLCSFWYIDNLTLQGRLQDAMDRFDRAVSRTNALGLLPEEIDPGTGHFLGNFPQAFSHLGMISTGFTLGRALRGEQKR
jgi:GH15 family glucan-1,4-alpha-glucosidase